VSDRVFVDTAGWACLFVETETCHSAAKTWLNQARRQNLRLFTTNYILIELVALLNSPLRVPRPKLFQYVDAIKTAPYVNLIHVDAAIDDQAWKLLKNRVDKHWSLVDATSIVIMKQLGIRVALTTDRHFEQAGFVRLLG
jgi:predicted nucleic acid-binding protein